MKVKICRICGAGKMKKRIGTEMFQCKGKSLAIPDYVTYGCVECGELYR